MLDTILVEVFPTMLSTRLVEVFPTPCPLVAVANPPYEDPMGESFPTPNIRLPLEASTNRYVIIFATL